MPAPTFITLNAEETYTLTVAFNMVIKEDLTHHETLVAEILIAHGVLSEVRVPLGTQLRKV